MGGRYGEALLIRFSEALLTVFCKLSDLDAHHILHYSFHRKKKVLNLLCFLLNQKQQAVNQKSCWMVKRCFRTTIGEDLSHQA